MRKTLLLVTLGVALAGLLPAAQGAAPKVKLVSCVNSLYDNEPGALNRCKNARTLHYDFMASTDDTIYTSDEGVAIEVWPTTTDGKLSAGPCYGESAGCTKVSDSFAPSYMAASPDGKHLYVVGQFNSGISIHEIAPNGSLTYRDCVGMVGASDSCSEHAPGSVDNGFIMFQPVVSPDGARVYVPDYRGILTFRRQTNGTLDYVGCAKLARSSCGPRQTWPFTGSHAGIAVSPDSRFIYVVGGTNDTYKVKGNIVDAVTVLERTDGAPGVRVVQTLKLPLWGVDNREGAPASAVSPDGRHVYAVAKNKLMTFARDKANGKVRLVRCIGNDAYSYDTKACVNMQAGATRDFPDMREPFDVTVTRDGRGVAVASVDGLFYFRRNVATGSLLTVVKRKGDTYVTPLACAGTLKGSGTLRCQNDIPFQGFSPGHIALSKRGDRLFTTAWAQTVLASVTSPFGGKTVRLTSATTAVEHRLGINNWMVGATRSQAKKVYRGIEIKPLKFAVGLDLISEHGSAPTTETVRMALPKGLSWGPRVASPRTLWPNGVPDYWSFTADSQSCTVAGQVATCRAVGVPDSTNLFGWILDVEAAAPGKYTIHGEVVSPTDGTNRAPRGAQTPVSADLNLIVGERSGAVTVGRIVLSRTRPSFVNAKVDVKQGGILVRADSLMCTTSFPAGPALNQAKVPPSFYKRYISLGSVTCPSVFNNARYQGKTMVGTMVFTVGKTKVTKKYSVRIGPGTSLSSAKGAVIGKP